MRKLLLLRHAKAVPGGPKVDDHGRELAARGREDAPAIGRYIRKQEFEPQLMLVSTSRRTLETAELAADEFRSKPEIEFVAALYLAEADVILAAIQRASDDAKRLCVVGHNPGLEICASLLARDPVKRKERDYFDAIEEKFPTGALAVLGFDVKQWRDVKFGDGTLIDFVRPRDL